MPRSSLKTVEQTETRLLAYLDSAAYGRTRTACVSLRRMAEALGITESRVNFARKRLIASGAVESELRYSEDGGCISNAYRLTHLGRARLAYARSTGVLEELDFN